MHAVNIVIVSHFEDSNGDDDFYEAKSVDQYDESDVGFAKDAQEVISFFEGRGYCLDAGGDSNTADWDIADPNPFSSQHKAESAAKAVLRALERKLVDYKI